MTPEAMIRHPNMAELSLALMPPIRGHLKGHPRPEVWPRLYRALQTAMLHLIAEAQP